MKKLSTYRCFISVVIFLVIVLAGCGDFTDTDMIRNDNMRELLNQYESEPGGNGCAAFTNNNSLSLVVQQNNYFGDDLYCSTSAVSKTVNIAVGNERAIPGTEYLVYSLCSKRILMQGLIVDSGSLIVSVNTNVGDHIYVKTTLTANPYAESLIIIGPVL